MIKILMRLVMIVLVVGLIAGGSLLGAGYEEYKKVIQEVSLEESVQAIRADDNFVSIETVDENFLHAVIAIEDHRFYKHGAIDPISFVRASIVNLIEGEFVQGGSTITQQLAKNMYFTSEQTLQRKSAELFVAIELEKQYTKDDILELYINEVYFGNGCYGIREASLGFFGKEPTDLTKDEAALLAGLLQAPSLYAGNEALAKERQEQVLQAMEANSYLEMVKNTD